MTYDAAGIAAIRLQRLIHIDRRVLGRLERQLSAAKSEPFTSSILHWFHEGRLTGEIAAYRIFIEDLEDLLTELTTNMEGL